MSKTAFLTGTTGQDGSYLVELLLNKGYEVHGIVRRASTFNTSRIDHLIENPNIFGKRFFTHFSDVTDPQSLNELITKIQPDEVYNLAAQSHVKVSFEIPYYTAQVDAIGTLNVLESVRNHCPNAKVYQASTSEMFGGQPSEIPRSGFTETSPFHPRSPYGCAKVYAYWITKNYREAYNMFACNGLLFNHETVSSFMPMIYKISENVIDIKPISEICRYETGIIINEDNKVYQEGTPIRNVEVWDNSNWTKVKYVSCYPHDVEKDNKNPKIINARNAVIMSTSDHIFFKENNDEVKCGDIKIGDTVKNIKFPKSKETIILDKRLCFLLGAIAGDGYVSDDNRIVYTSKNEKEIDLIDSIWKSLDENNTTRRELSYSGFTKLKNIWHIYLKGNTQIVTNFVLYNNDDTKRVPYEILNTSKDCMIEYLKGYNMADGLKSNPCVYDFRNFKTNSPTLAQGLVYLISQTTKQEINITVEPSEKWGYKTFYYSINMLSNSSSGQNHKNSEDKMDIIFDLINSGESQRSIARITGISRGFIRKIQNGYLPTNEHHLTKPNNEVKKIIDYDDYDGWFYDLETESGTFHCGVGYGHVHNSPRRGDTFVTKKITNWVKAWDKDKSTPALQLGNLNSYRDWGHASDYVEAQWLILQQDNPDDYVIATGSTYTVKNFLQECFRYIGKKIEWVGSGLDEKGYCDGKLIVSVNPKYFRPSEVDYLLGNPSKAMKQLNWQPKFTFETLVQDMMKNEK